MIHNSETGLIESIDYIRSPNCDLREGGAEPEVIVVHSISLPPGEYGGGAIGRFFTNGLSANEHPYYEHIAGLKVSAHFLVERGGRLIQFVPTHLRAWHAGESVCLGRPKVNNFSIGIELEGLETDSDGFTDKQYRSLKLLAGTLRKAYPKITATNLFAHSDIAPGRKFDPGPFFEWGKFFV